LALAKANIEGRTLAKAKNLTQGFSLGTKYKIQIGFSQSKLSRMNFG
jgi:hypothetical protein